VLKDKEFLPVIYRCIEDSREEILVAMYEWGWFSGAQTGTIQDINRALVRAVKRGVVCRVVLHNEAMGRPLGRSNRLTRGHLQRHGLHVQLGTAHNPVHAKVWLFDGKQAVVGSHNLSRHSCGRNHEVSVLFDDPDAISELKRWFESLWWRER